MLKRLRGFVKMFLPCAVQWAFMRRRYGMEMRFRGSGKAGLAGLALRFFMQLMPYGLVKRYEVRIQHGQSARRAGLKGGASSPGRLSITPYEWKLLVASRLFDEKWYEEQYGKEIPEDFPPSLHYLLWGWKRGFNPSPEFNAAEYVRMNPGTENVNPLLDFIRRGAGGARQFPGPVRPYPQERLIDQIVESGLFDASDYGRAAHLTEGASERETVRHYLDVGWKDGMSPSSGFCNEEYLALNKDVAGMEVCPLEHWLCQGQYEGRRYRLGVVERLFGLSMHPPGRLCRFASVSLRRWRYFSYYGETQRGLEQMAEDMGFFDREWYCRQYPDVVSAGVDPRAHYFSEGWREGRNPSERFNTTFYLARYHKVLFSGENPLLHYVKKGLWEGWDNCAAGPFREGVPTARDRRICAKKTKTPFFSVVVASYNYEKLVIEALESVMSQTYRNFEIVVVDDGSSDRSRENIREFIERHAGGDVKIELFTHPGGENRGLAATVRLGVEKSRGEYVAFCEADDLWTPDHLAEVVRLVNSYANPGVIVNDVEIFGDAVRCFKFEKIKMVRYKLMRRTVNRIPRSAFRETNYILSFSACAVRRDLLLKCDYNPVSHKAALDWWLWRQLCFDEPVYFINRILTRWRMHDSYMARTQQDADAQKRKPAMVRAFVAGLDSVIRRRHPFSPSVWFTPELEFTHVERYRIPFARRCRMLWERWNGRRRYGEWIKAHSRVRILVCLHLYYEQSWKVISEYLKNLSPYGYDLTVTYVEGLVGESVLRRIRAFHPKVRLLPCENLGYDVWPFAKALEGVDLDGYDVVFKLHSKGIQRPRLYMYGQLFKLSDWFFNLFDGVLGGYAVHEAVHALASGRKHDIAAAGNLIVKDPKYKVAFVREWCGKRGLKFHEGYRFVAGTCFAARAEMMKPLQRLNLSASDFEGAVPGTFSLAHFLERYMCFVEEGRMFPIEVRHPAYESERAHEAAVCSVRLLDDPRFKLDYEFFYKVLEPMRIWRYDVVRIRLGDIKRYWYDGRVYPLSECAPYKYLNGDGAAYDEYCRANEAQTGFAMTRGRFESLRADMAEYDPLMMPVVQGSCNILLDGQHRSCILLKKYGPDHEISVLRIR